MAVILAYTSPALGHLYPYCALLQELATRGHEIHIRTLAAGLELCRDLGFHAEPVDPQIEALRHDDGVTGVLRAAAETVRTLGRRAVLEVADMERAVRTVRPDLVLVDANCWGAISFAETQTVPWLVFSPFIPYLRSPGSPPFGAGARPRPGRLGQVRDWGVSLVTRQVFDRPFRRGVAPVRTMLGVPPVRSADRLLRRAPAVLVATGKPFEYSHTDWGSTVELIGPALFDPAPAEPPGWLRDIDHPIVLVTTSSLPQADNRLVDTTIEALRGEPVHVVATSPTGPRVSSDSPARVTLAQFVPHSVLLDRAVCVVTHGGMGVTQKALSRGIPVCVVPFGRDQFEVARRVEVAGCGTRLPARRLTPSRLRIAIGEAMKMTNGIAAVAAGFDATGGMHRGADIVEQHLRAADCLTAPLRSSFRQGEAVGYPSTR